MAPDSNTPSEPPLHEYLDMEAYDVVSGKHHRAEAHRLSIAEQALRDIVRCDYRGNGPSEQMIARLALADMERERR